MDAKKAAFLDNLPSVRRHVYERTHDELIGICEGIIADKAIVPEEAKFLLRWMRSARDIIHDDPMADMLLRRLTDMLADNTLDEDEQKELMLFLKKFTGHVPHDVHLSHTMKAPTSLPLNNPQPPVIHPGRAFCFTGLMSFAPREECERIVQDLGGHPQVNLRLDTSYLVIGNIASPYWKHSTYGTKIKKGLDYRDKRNTGLAIINEDHWLGFALQPSVDADVERQNVGQV